MKPLHTVLLLKQSRTGRLSLADQLLIDLIDPELQQKHDRKLLV